MVDKIKKCIRDSPLGVLIPLGVKTPSKIPLDIPYYSRHPLDIHTLARRYVLVTAGASFVLPADYWANQQVFYI